jgi:regulator of cell morphogenesis and NO signaling
MKAEKGGAFEWRRVEDGPDLWKVEIRKTGPDVEAAEVNEDIQSDILVLNAAQLEPHTKYPTIFSHFDSLNGGEAFEVVEDHDPKPLYYQLLAIRGNVFTWQYKQEGPEWWKVQIAKKDIEHGETVGQIAAKDLRKAEVLKRFGISFYCCGGKKTLKQVCEEKGLDFSTVETALENAQHTEKATEHFDSWSLDFLTDYIYHKHHVYYYDENPVIADLLNKVIIRHGEHYSVLQRVFDLYKKLTLEINAHSGREEEVVFPFIKSLVHAKCTGNVESLSTQFSLADPVTMMENEHEDVTQNLLLLREATENYTAPHGACDAFRFLYRKLKELDEDLHQHIHLENNILFPKAVALEKELRSSIL